MVVSSEIVFACYSKACAPPPAGKGGSVKGAVSQARRGRAMAAKDAAEGGGKTVYKPAKGSWTQVASKMMTANSATITTRDRVAKVTLEKWQGASEGYNFRIVSTNPTIKNSGWREQKGGVSGSRSKAIKKVAGVIDGTDPVASRKVKG